MKCIFFILTLLLLYVDQIQSTTQESHSQIIKLTDKTFDSIINPNSSTKWIIIFHVKSCMYCLHIIQMIDEEIIPEFNKDKSTLFASVDCDENVWLAARFNVTKIPYTILIENNKMFEYKSLDSKDRFLQFINREKVMEESSQIPFPVSNLSMMIKIMASIFEHVNEVMQDHLNKRNITSFKWDYYLTGGLLLILFVLLVIVQAFVFKCICGFRKSNNTKMKRDNNKKEDSLSSNHSKKD